MRKPKIIVHCLVKNEENFIWYALQSVLPFVDKIMIWDTGSEDKTAEIIKSIKSPKIEYKKVGMVDRDSFTTVRNDMLKVTNSKEYEWLMILDGDEIWSFEAMKKVRKHIDSNPNTQAIFVKTINSIGDIYHKLPKSAGHYRVKGKSGHLGLRFMNLITTQGIHANLPHGQEGFFSKENILVQELPKVDYVDTAYLHTTHLLRSSQDKKTLKRSFKRKFELGELVNKSELPDILFKKHPTIVPDVTQHMGFITFLKCYLSTVPKKLRRKFVTLREGY